MANPYLDTIAELIDIITAHANPDDAAVGYVGGVLTRARALRDQAEPESLSNNYIDPEHIGRDRELLKIFYTACQAEGGTADEIHLRGIRAVVALQQGRQGEVAELVAWLREQEAMAYAIVDFAEARRYARAADLLQQLHQYSRAGRVDG